MKSMLSGVALGGVATVLVAIAVWLTGDYNVAASDQHADAVRWTLDTTMRRSGDIELPDSFSEEVVAQGAGHYSESCVYCHGAPDQDPTEWSRGMRPEPPHLMEAATHWSAEEIYWIVENGIKMSGMPAFGAHHGPEGLAAITAFVTQLPGLSPEDYRTLTGGGAATAAEGAARTTNSAEETTDGAAAAPAD